MWMPCWLVCMTQGLEDQLLAEVVRKERPELEEQRDRLVVSISADKRQLKARIAHGGPGTDRACGLGAAHGGPGMDRVCGHCRGCVLVGSFTEPAAESAPDAAFNPFVREHASWCQAGTCQLVTC